MNQERGSVVILLKVTETKFGEKAYEILQDKDLETLLYYQQLLRMLFQDYKQFDEKKDTSNSPWIEVGNEKDPIRIKPKKKNGSDLRQVKLTSLGSQQNRQTSRGQIVELVRIIEYPNEKRSYQALRGRKLDKFLEEISWLGRVLENYELEDQKISWLEVEPIESLSKRIARLFRKQD